MTEVRRFPMQSRAARVAAPVLRGTLRPLLEHLPLTGRTLRYAYLADQLAGVLPEPSGALTERVTLPGFDAELVTAPGVHAGAGLVLHFHGGAFIGGGLRSHRRLVARISAAAGLPVLNVAYRQLPVAGLDESIDDCLTAYRWALTNLAHDGTIVLSGDSAGGYLIFALAARAAQDGIQAPTAMVALSPWLDLECRHSADHANAALDPYMPSRQLARIGTLLAKRGIHRHVPPLDSDLSGFPPVLIQVGSSELLLSDAERLAERLTSYDVPNTLQIWEGQMHVFQAAADVLPEARAAIAEIGEFLRSTFRIREPKEAQHG